MGANRIRQTARGLLDDGEVGAALLAALTIVGISVGWATGSVVAGESMIDQVWLVAVLAGFVAVVVGLDGDIETER